MNRNTLVAAVVAAILPGLALAEAAGVGVGATGGTYSATAASAGLTSHAGINGSIGTFSQSAGTQSAASAGMAIGARETNSLSVAYDGATDFTVGLTSSSVASIEGFGTASSVTSTSYAGDGIQGGASGGTLSFGAANAAGAFGGVAIIGADAN